MPTSDEPHRSPRHLMTAAIVLVALIGAAIYFGWTHFYGASNQTLPAFIPLGKPPWHASLSG